MENYNIYKNLNQIPTLAIDIFIYITICFLHVLTEKDLNLLIFFYTNMFWIDFGKFLFISKDADKGQ